MRSGLMISVPGNDVVLFTILVNDSGGRNLFGSDRLVGHASSIHTHASYSFVFHRTHTSCVQHVHRWNKECAQFGECLYRWQAVRLEFGEPLPTGGKIPACHAWSDGLSLGSVGTAQQAEQASHIGDSTSGSDQSQLC